MIQALAASASLGAASVTTLSDDDQAKKVVAPSVAKNHQPVIRMAMEEA